MSLAPRNIKKKYKNTVCTTKLGMGKEPGGRNNEAFTCLTVYANLLHRMLEYKGRIGSADSVIKRKLVKRPKIQ